jgi:hypothetical protein
MNVSHATDVTGCMNITSSDTYNLINNINDVQQVCFNVTSNDVIFDCNYYLINLTQMTGVVFNLNDINNITLQNCLISTDDNSMNVNNVTNLLVENFYISHQQNVAISNSENITIRNVTFNGTYYEDWEQPSISVGIDLLDTNNVLLQDITMYNVYDNSIQFVKSSGSGVHNITIKNVSIINEMENTNGYLLFSDGDDMLIENLYTYNVSYLRSYYVDNFTINNYTCNKTQDTCIRLENGINNSTLNILNSKFYLNDDYVQAGISSDGYGLHHNLIIENNEFYMSGNSDSKTAISSIIGDYILVRNNKFYMNDTNYPSTFFRGLWIDHFSNSTIEGNEFHNCNACVTGWYSPNLIVRNNTFDDNFKIGVEISENPNAYIEISNNTFKSTTYRGIRIEQDTNNSFINISNNKAINSGNIAYFLDVLYQWDIDLVDLGNLLINNNYIENYGGFFIRPYSINSINITNNNISLVDYGRYAILLSADLLNYSLISNNYIYTNPIKQQTGIYIYPIDFNYSFNNNYINNKEYLFYYKNCPSLIDLSSNSGVMFYCNNTKLKNGDLNGINFLGNNIEIENMKISNCRMCYILYTNNTIIKNSLCNNCLGNQFIQSFNDYLINSTINVGYCECSYYKQWWIDFITKNFKVPLIVDNIYEISPPYRMNLSELYVNESGTYNISEHNVKVKENKVYSSNLTTFLSDTNKVISVEVFSKLDTTIFSIYLPTINFVFILFILISIIPFLYLIFGFEFKVLYILILALIGLAVLSLLIGVM